jgi:hypothetical protein
VFSGINARNRPGLRFVVIADRHSSAFSDLNREGAVEVVEIEKVVFDVFTFVAKTQNEAMEPEGRVVLYQVPEDGAASDIHHWLGDNSRLFSQTSAHSAAKDDYRNIVHGFASVCCGNPQPGRAGVPFDKRGYWNVGKKETRLAIYLDARASFDKSEHQSGNKVNKKFLGLLIKDRLQPVNAY